MTYYIKAFYLFFTTPTVHKNPERIFMAIVRRQYRLRWLRSRKAILTGKA